MTAAPSKRPAEWLREHFKSNPKASGVLKDAQVDMLVTFVAKRSEKAVDAWQNAPPSAVEGALIYQANECATCHKLNGVGDELGPSLNGVGERHERAWIEQHFADPAKFSPESMMPATKFKPEDLKFITDYITSIPK